MAAREVSAKAKKRAVFEEAEQRRADAIEHARRGLSMSEISGILGVSMEAIRRWTIRYPEFKRDLAEARQKGRTGRAVYDGSFIGFRASYLGMDTTWFQHKIVDAIENARPGEVTMVLIPPEHGKTTLLEDWCTYKLCTDPAYRITVASETVDHGVKMIERVRHRLEPDGPTPLIHQDFGPLAPEEGSRSQVWGARQFDVAQKRQSDERDYSMRAVGLTGRVQGTRCDLLLLDDIQDVKSLDLSKKYFDLVTQSFLSRPSMFGRTVIIGTRVGEFDVYRLLMDAEIDDALIKIPAYNIPESPDWPQPKVKPHIDKPETWAPEGTKFLWPDKYDDKPGDGLHRFRYAFLRHRLGEQAWARNYMQAPELAATMTFDEATIEEMKDVNRSVLAKPHAPADDELIPVIIALDPAVGSVNAVLTAAVYPDRMEVLNVRRDVGLGKYSEIFDILEEECIRWSTRHTYISTMVIEDKAFQRGLLRDDRMVELSRAYEFRVVPNTTNKEKTDPDIGVPSVPLSIWRGEITIPWGDEASQKAMQPLIDDLQRWRPGIPGTKLPQDHVMTLWFAVRQWRAQRRNTPRHPRPDTESFGGRPSPLRSRRGRTLGVNSSRSTYRRMSRGRTR